MASPNSKVIGLANGGDDLVNAVKQAGEFGITRRGQRLAAMLIFINNVNAMGLNSAQGLTLTETFLAFGVDELSVTPRSVLPLRNAVRMTDTRESSERILSDLDSDYTAR